MATITISRGTLSGGSRLAECLGRSLGYRVIGREELTAAAAKAYGVDHGDLARGMVQAPKLRDRLRIDRQIHLAVTQATLCRMARGEDIVYHGHAGHLLLSDVGHVLRIRIIAPLSQRIRAARAGHDFTEVEAVAYIRRRDDERRAWTRFLYGIEWDDPALYDLTVNLERISIEVACSATATISERPEYQATEKTLRQLDDLFLAAHVRASLFLNPKISAAAAKLEVKACDGVVTLAGILPSGSLVEEVLKTGSALPEVKDIHADWMGSRLEPV